MNGNGTGEIPLNHIGNNKLFLFLSTAERIRQDNITVIRQMRAKGYKVLVVTTNQPYLILRRMYEKNGIDLTCIYFVDAITRYAAGTVPEGTPDCHFVNSPSNLTDLGIAITEAMSRLGGAEICILLDSISTMLIYIPSVNISKFIHFITSKLRLVNAAGVFLAVEKGLDPLLMTQLTTFVDEIIDLETSTGEKRDPLLIPGTGMK